MGKKLPSDVRKNIQRLVFSKAEDFGYGSRSRPENSVFLDSLVENLQIGGTLKQYMNENAVRTYIKDAVLNAYAKAEVRKKLNRITLQTVIRQLYHAEAFEIGKSNQTSIYRSESKDFYLIHTGTYLKWESALRKLLECVAASDIIKDSANTVNLCLLLTVSNGEMTFADQQQLEKTLGYINVKVFFAR